MTNWINPHMVCVEFDNDTSKLANEIIRLREQLAEKEAERHEIMVRYLQAAEKLEEQQLQFSHAGSVAVACQKYARELEEQLAEAKRMVYLACEIIDNSTVSHMTGEHMERVNKLNDYLAKNWEEEVPQQ